MRIGDLVEINDTDQTDGRGKGIILKFDTYTDARFKGLPEAIVEVLWSDNTVGWILKKRLDNLTYACNIDVPVV